MPNSIIALAILFVGAAAADKPNDIPGKAVCTTCSIKGAPHGEEEVTAWREYEGKRYYFCSNDCAEAFDDFPAAYVEHPIPRPAPDAIVTTIDGAELALADLRGKVVLLDFWATWCKPCRESMPALDKMHAQWSDRGLAVLGVSIDKNPAEVVPRFIDKYDLSYPIVLDTTPRPAWLQYHVAAIPVMFLIDAEGQIVAEWRGEIDTGDVHTAVEALLSKTPR